MRLRAAKPQTADLFAAADAMPAPAIPAPAVPTPAVPAPPTAPASTESPAGPGPPPHRALKSVRADGVPPVPHTAGQSRAKQLWYAVVFPEMADAEQSAVTLRRLCLSAQQFTSLVSIEMPNALLLEVKGSIRLFGSLKVLHAGIDAAWSRLALRSHSATAPSTLAALWCARGGKQVCSDDPGSLAGCLAELPIACTSWDAEHLQTLRSMGVTRMAELLRLPRAGLARRLGPAAVLDLDIALARQLAPRRAFVPRERFRERCDFETEIENVAYLERALEPLIERCARFLRERQAGVQTLRLKLRHRTGPATGVHLGLASITSERRRLMDVLCQTLTRLELKAPVRGTELLSGSLRPLSAASLDAFAGWAGAGAATGAGCGRDSVPQLVERLRARLGEDAVYGICSIPEHRPELAWSRVRELPGSRMADAAAIDEGMPRPVWLLNEPLPLDEPLPLPEPLLVSKPEMPPWHRGSVVLEQGPERIESGWWDGKGVARDYYVASRPSHGARLWVFQERRSKRWYLHGVFA